MRNVFPFFHSSGQFPPARPGAIDAKSRLGNPRLSAFTLLEILAAIAVFTILLVCVTQMLNMGQAASSHAIRRIETEQEARFILDRIARDLGQALCRPDVDLKAARLAGDDALAFYAEISTYGSGRKLGIVSYRMRPEGLQRGLDNPGDDGMVFLPRNLTNQSGVEVPPDEILSDSLYDTLSSEVIRAEFLLIGNDGRAIPAGAAWNPRMVSGVLAVLVMVDKSSRALLTDAQTGALAAQFSDLPEQATTMVTDITAPWVKKILSPDFQQQALPGRVKQTIRVYQRFFPLKS